MTVEEYKKIEKIVDDKLMSYNIAIELRAQLRWLILKDIKELVKEEV